MTRSGFSYQINKSEEGSLSEHVVGRTWNDYEMMLLFSLCYDITSFLDRTFPYWAEEDNDDDESSISSVSSIQTDDLLDDVEL